MTNPPHFPRLFPGEGDFCPCCGTRRHRRKPRRKVQISLPLEADDPAAPSITLFHPDGEHPDELYIAPTMICALAVAKRLLEGGDVPVGYQKFPDGDFK